MLYVLTTESIVILVVLLVTGRWRPKEADLRQAHYGESIERPAETPADVEILDNHDGKERNEQAGKHIESLTEG
jgi:hypothetical protein